MVLARDARAKNVSCYGVKACTNMRKAHLSRGKSPREGRVEKTGHKKGLPPKAVNSEACTSTAEGDARSISSAGP